MTSEFKQTKNMSASNTYGVLTIMSAVLLVPPMLFFEGFSSPKESFDSVQDKATLLKASDETPLAVYVEWAVYDCAE